MPYLRALSAFRDGVRKLAMEGASAADILALSDKFRDEDAVELGLALDDQAGMCERAHFFFHASAREANLLTTTFCLTQTAVHCSNSSHRRSCEKRATPSSQPREKKLNAKPPRQQRPKRSGENGSRKVGHRRVKCSSRTRTSTLLGTSKVCLRWTRRGLSCPSLGRRNCRRSGTCRKSCMTSF